MKKNISKQQAEFGMYAPFGSAYSLASVSSLFWSVFGPAAQYCFGKYKPAYAYVFAYSN